MTPHPPMEVSNPVTSTTLADATPELSAKELAARVGRSTYWVKENARRGRIPHLRLGERQEGKRDVRPIYFTEEQARQVEAWVNRVEYVPADL